MTPQAPGGGRAGSRVRFRYRQREDSKPGDRHYDVFKQERPRARWEPLGWVMGLSHESGPTSWAGLRDGANAWTEWKTTRGAAAQDMAEGRTFLTPTHERAAQEAWRSCASPTSPGPGSSRSPLTCTRPSRTTWPPSKPTSR